MPDQLACAGLRATATVTKEVVFDLAYLEIGMCLDCRPPANNVLSEVTAR